MDNDMRQSSALMDACFADNKAFRSDANDVEIRPDCWTEAFQAIAPYMNVKMTHGAVENFYSKIIALQCMVLEVTDGRQERGRVRGIFETCMLELLTKNKRNVHSEHA
jgi:hypothetical protein